MSRPAKDIECRAGISVIATDSTTRGAGITLRVRATDGPGNTKGRTVNVQLIPSDIAFALSTIATLPEYRKIWHGIATELDRLDDIVSNGAPVQAVQASSHLGRTSAIRAAIDIARD